MGRYTPPTCEAIPDAHSAVFSKRPKKIMVHREVIKVAFYKPYSIREMEYIRSNYPAKSATKIAEELGRSRRGVYKKIEEMHLKDAPQGTVQATVHKKPVPDNKRYNPQKPRAKADQQKQKTRISTKDGGLDGLKSLIWSAMVTAEPQDLAKLAPEYRKTLEALELKEQARVPQTQKQNTEDGLADVINLVRTS